MAVFLDFGRICRGREWNEKEKDGEKKGGKYLGNIERLVQLLSLSASYVSRMKRRRREERRIDTSVVCWSV